MDNSKTPYYPSYGKKNNRKSQLTNKQVYSIISSNIKSPSKKSFHVPQYNKIPKSIYKLNKETFDIISSAIKSNFNFKDVDAAVSTPGRVHTFRGKVSSLPDCYNCGNKNLKSKAPINVRNAKHKFAILFGGDCNKNLGNACNRDLLAIYREVLEPVYDIDISNIFIITQVNDVIKKIFNGAYIREMTPENFEQATIDILNKVNKIKENESVFIYIHYSGHGYQIPNELGYKKGQRDEALLVGPSTLVTGEDIRDNFIAKFGPNVQIFSLWDACHSGSVADLPFKFSGVSWSSITLKEEKRRQVRAKVISISACDDNQVDAQIVGKKMGYGGALTIYFYEKDLYYNINDPKYVYNQLFKHLKDINQTPILTSSWKF